MGKDKEEKNYDFLKKYRSRCHANCKAFTEEKNYGKIM